MAAGRQERPFHVLPEEEVAAFSGQELGMPKLAGFVKAGSVIVVSGEEGVKAAYACENPQNFHVADEASLRQA